LQAATIWLVNGAGTACGDSLPVLAIRHIGRMFYRGSVFRFSCVLFPGEMFLRNTARIRPWLADMLLRVGLTVDPISACYRIEFARLRFAYGWIAVSPLIGVVSRW